MKKRKTFDEMFWHIDDIFKNARQPYPRKIDTMNEILKT